VVVGSNPSAAYWMAKAMPVIQITMKKKEIKVVKWGTPKTYYKKTFKP
jgi:hypothetical protein